MNYCILVTISRNSISFRYNRMDGDNRFVDFMQDGGSEMPFAIECVGNEFVIGKSALESAIKKLAPNAFANIFDTCKEMRTFRFAGRDEQLNKLPFYAIKDYVGKILSDRFYGQVGNIDNNVSKLPLVFLFTPELDTDKKLFITSPFEKGGFQNICSISYHQLLLPIIMDSLPEKQNPNVAIMVSVDRNDLILQFYDAVTDKLLADLVRIKGQGSDPRLKQAMDLIWAGLNNYNYQPRDPEENVLRDAALKFLNSNLRTVNDVLCMSDGSMQDYCLSRDELDMSAIGEACRLVSHHLNEALINKGLSIQQCQIILVGNAATDYFENIFSQMALAYPVKTVLEKEKNLMLDRLLGLVKKANYEVSNLFSKRTENMVAPPYSSCSSENDAIHTPSPTDKRKVRTMMAEIKGKIRVKNYGEATTLAHSLLDNLRKLKIDFWDKDIHSLLEEIPKEDPKKEPKPKEEPKCPPKEETKEDSKKYQREVRRQIAEAKAAIRKGDMRTAEKMLKTLKKAMNNKGFSLFDKEIDSALASAQPPQHASESKSSSTKTATKKLAGSEQLLVAGQFSEAKRAFASEGNSAMAQLCSELIKSKRTISSYQSELEAAIRNRNKSVATKAVRELTTLLATYQKYGIRSTELKQLINNYKTI